MIVTADAEGAEGEDEAQPPQAAAKEEGKEEKEGSLACTVS